MMSAPFRKYPMTFAPQVRPALWGCERWLVSGYPARPSVVENGEYAGRTLSDLVDTFGAELTGTKAAAGKPFPLLIKIIEAQEHLSLQVHPNEQTRELCGGDPKTEMWYVLDGAPDARIFAGFRRGVDREALAKAISEGDVEEMVVSLPAEQGGVLFIPGGLVHAIGGGCRLYEVQQTSDTTWRLHDWNRVDPKTGQPRPLNEREGMAAIDWTLPPPTLRRAASPVVCEHFRFSGETVIGERRVRGRRESFRILFVAAGDCEVGSAENAPVSLPSGGCVLVPAGLDFMLTARDPATVLVAEL